MRFGYGTNGFDNHRLDDALAILADLGYDGVAITLDHHHLDPYSFPDVSRIARRLGDLGLSCVVETGARYLLDPWRKHQPTLFDSDRRIDLLRRACAMAADLGATAVSFWSGSPPDLEDPWDRLTHACAEVLEAADRYRVPLGFEPEPGMFIDTIDGYLALRDRLGAPDLFGLTLDIGHCRCLEPAPVAECVRRALPYLVNVQIDDMRRGVHEHLEFGEGEIEFAPVLAALRDFPGLVAVELPRHSHAAVDVARRSLAFLRKAESMARSLHEACDLLRTEPRKIATLFPAAARTWGEESRQQLIAALPRDAAARELPDLYRYGDAGEKLAVLRALEAIDGDEGVPLVLDALRTNDTRLIESAMGGYAAAHLPADAWRQGVLKCVFCGIPLARVAGLGQRTDPELVRMLADYARERTAAGREVAADVMEVVHAHL
ncbi:EboA domain-containing protein [Nonomuraea sediminis]|uniref:EboA domain-containing protein n=1 Tax=Nonomuraea sediminis TaxID=2835864 RepID=UPI001BDDA51E|nr:EboA domain-containing protein [Nonomuraea sediminis]